MGRPSSGFPARAVRDWRRPRPSARCPDTRLSRRSVSTTSPPRRVDQEAARAHLRQIAVDHSTRGIGKRHVQTDDIRDRDELVEFQPLDLMLLEDLLIDYYRVAGHNLHAEGTGTNGDGLANSPQTD